MQEKLRCSAGETIITADATAKVFDEMRFEPAFMAQVAVSKCADSLPLYRRRRRTPRQEIADHGNEAR